MKRRKLQTLSSNVLWLAVQCFQWEYITWWREHSATTLRNSQKDQATANPVMQILKEKGESDIHKQRRGQPVECDEQQLRKKKSNLLAEPRGDRGS